MCRWLILFFLIKCVFMKFAFAKTSSAIPENLLSCYRNNYTTIFPKPPLTMRLLVEIIQKIELDEKNSLNMRLLTTSMLHGVRLDGVLKSPTNLEAEYLVPFRARGMQFYKYQLLVDYLISGESSLFPEDSVMTSELCLLHEMISSTVNPWERGDERKTCPLTRSMPNTENSSVEYSITGELSRCPQESGVVQTEWGTVSPGHLIAGVAAALQKTTVQLRELIDAINDDQNKTDTGTYKTVTDVNNVWASTIVGDIAEVVVNQNTENPIVGNVGFWNDTFYPRAHYLTGREWDLTDAELLGGIDGALIANEVTKWSSVLDRTRFSQLLEMYYSNRGVSYDTTYRACNRQAKFPQIYQREEVVKQTGSVAKLLQIMGTPTEFIQEEGIDVLAKIAVKHYERKSESKMSSYSCDEKSYRVDNSLEVILILGGSWSSYDARQSISAIADVADVSYYGSKIGVINGHTGKWITNVTGSLIKLYADLTDENITWPTTLSLSQSLEAVISYYQNKTKENCDGSKTSGKIILVLTNSARITDVDYKRAIAAIRSIKNSNPEASILYVTSDSNAEAYETLRKLYENDLLLKTNADLDSFKKSLWEILSNKPGNLINFYCDDSVVQHEVYVTPNVTSLFEINNAYIRKADISIKFKNNGYADLIVCAYDSKAVEMQVCKTAIENDVSFYVKDHCSSLTTCNVHFSIMANNTRFKCAELECRYPDQARVNVYTSWTKRSGSDSSFVNSPLLIFLMAFVLYYSKRTPLLLLYLS